MYILFGFDIIKIVTKDWRFRRVYRCIGAEKKLPPFVDLHLNLQKIFVYSHKTRFLAFDCDPFYEM